MYNFKYHNLTSIAEAKEKLEKLDEPKLLAGGQTLNATLKLRLANPKNILNLSKIADLKKISIEDNNVIVGSMCTHSLVQDSKIINDKIPSIGELASGIGDRMVRNMGTIGGSIANNDPAADYPAALIAMEANIITNLRVLKSEDFFMSLYDTALKENEIIIAISFPIHEKANYQKFKNPASRYAVVGVFVAKNKDQIKVAVTGASNKVFRVKEIEDALCKNFNASSLENIRIKSDDLNSDLHASNVYRAHLIKILSLRAVNYLKRQDN